MILEIFQASCLLCLLVGCGSSSFVVAPFIWPLLVVAFIVRLMSGNPSTSRCMRFFC